MFDRYERLLEKVDERLDELGPCGCPPGCDQCCRIEFSLFPVEAFFLREAVLRLPAHVVRLVQATPRAVQSPGILPAGVSSDAAECPFLLDHRCAVYGCRPVICRTYGLPFLLRREDGDGADIHTGCEILSLRTRLGSETGSSRISAFDMDAINAALVAVNRDFVLRAGRPKQQWPLRIPMAAIPCDDFSRGCCRADI